MRNVAPSGAISRFKRDLRVGAVVVALLGVLAVLIGVALNVINFVNPTAPMYGAYTVARALVLGTGGLMLLGSAGVVVWTFFQSEDNSLANLTAKALGLRLDDRYTFVRNVSKLGIGYIDAVLIGPPGLLVFRVLDKTGRFINEGGNWVKTNARGENVLMNENPTRDVRHDMDNLNKYLADNQFTGMPIFGVVVFVKEPPVTQVTGIQSELPVAQLSNLIEALVPNYLSQDRLNDQQIQKLVGLIYDR
jgi:hypothetical protein